MARPRKGSELAASEGVALRITKEQRAGLDDRAKRNDRSLSDEIRVAIDRHLAGEPPKLRAPITEAPKGSKASTRVGSDVATYYGIQIWPVEIGSWRKPDDPTIPTKADANNTYWFVEELHRALVANGASHRTAARYVRNWSKYIAALERPVAAASIMQDMAQGIDTFALNPDSGLDLKNRMPGRPTKFSGVPADAAERAQRRKAVKVRRRKK